MLAAIHHPIHHDVPVHCRRHHGSRYCAALEQRHAIKVLRWRASKEEGRTHLRHRVFTVSWRVQAMAREIHRLRHRLRWLRSVPSWRPSDPAQVICMVWGSQCSNALRVARCESGLSTNATNGQYLGMFQMGDYARARYGHGSDAWTQARAAHAYYMDAGWRPWECAYITGVI